MNARTILGLLIAGCGAGMALSNLMGFIKFGIWVWPPITSVITIIGMILVIWGTDE
jgi:hypothetical protein